MRSTLNFPDAGTGARLVVVRDLVVTCMIGIHPSEHEVPQRVRVNLHLSVPESAQPLDDNIENVVDYDAIIVGVRTLLARGHTELIETVAERVAALCLEDSRVQAVKVLAEKLDVYRDAAAVGVEIVRWNARAESGQSAN